MNIFTKLSLTMALVAETLIGVQAQDGHIQDNFTVSKTTMGWTSATANATMVQDPVTGIITITPYSNGTSAYRGDFKKTASVASPVYLNKDTYPIFAIKFSKPVAVKVTFDTNLGSFGNGDTRYTEIVTGDGRNVYYYNLAASGAKFGANGIIADMAQPMSFSTFQFKIADMPFANGQIPYDIEWVQTFESLDHLLFAINKAVSEETALGWNERVDISWKASAIVNSCNIYRSTNENGPFVQIATGVTTSSYSDASGLTNGTVYYYQVRPIVNGVESNAGLTFSAIPNGTAGFDSWSHQDIGTSTTIGVTGNAGFTTDGTFSINAAGANIWQGNDGFHFVYQELEGDGVIVAKVEGLLNTANSAKAGVMIRETLDAGSRQALASFRPDFVPEFGHEISGSNTSYPAVTLNGTAGTYRWVKLVRVGAVVTSYYSVDGSDWEEGPSVTFTAGNMASGKVYAGIFAVSNTTAKLTTATFSNIELSAGTTPVSLTRYSAKLVNNGNVELNWNVASEQDNDHFTIERKQANGEFVEIAQIPSKGTGAANYSIIDNNATAGINYYRLSQTDKNGARTELGIQSVNVALDKSQALTVYPHPVTGGEFTFGYVTSSATIGVKLIDLSGKVVYQENIMASATNTYRVQLKNRAVAGVYVLLVDDKENKKVVIQ